jgi:hypothetical protein
MRSSDTSPELEEQLVPLAPLEGTDTSSGA